MTTRINIHYPSLYTGLIAAAGVTLVIWTVYRQFAPQEDGTELDDGRSCARPEAATGKPSCENQHKTGLSQSPETESSPASPTDQAVRAHGNAARIAQYEELTQDFVVDGLDLKALESAQVSFGGLEESDWPGIWPRPYPVPFPSVRLTVLPLDGGQLNAANPKLAISLSSVAREVAGALTGYHSYVNPRSGYHATLFYMSHPNDIRPDTSRDGGGELFRNGEVMVPTTESLDWEHLQVEQMSKGMSRITLEIERITFTRAGTLLVLFIDRTGKASPHGDKPTSIDSLRQRFRSGFPGAPTKQPRPIIHGTLLRLLAPCVPLQKAMKAKMLGICDKWTSKLKGTQYTVDTFWLVHETRFSSLEGEKKAFKLK
eukprot:CAMPEP_0118922602 /NCGR_PEP_ID=MMETSP1169-20130426/1477_1 /TAXON_ID=36882 /ORGANISM="Pyramimonas obovata, Strain CCMP722" /LENGTH=371 /DNA_ID=CAMNT_0006863507 /DNA_START=307 /DNA_END=1422 /DNA_ORIENTATION=-